MPSLLFEGSNNLKVSDANVEEETVMFSMENDLPDIQYSFLEINLTHSELEVLAKWLETQIYALEASQSRKNKNRRSG